MAETNKNLGKIGSASKCIEECELILNQLKVAPSKSQDPFYLKLSKLFQEGFLNQR